MRGIQILGAVFLLAVMRVAAADGAPAPVREDPTVPVARNLVWKDGNTWEKTHLRYVERARRGGVDIVFFGDSITQWWSWKDFKARYGSRGGVNFGIGGDKTQHLLWRVLNGEMDGIQPKVAVVLIGTNNLGNDSPAKIAEGITMIVQAIQQKSPSTKVLLLGIFPRGRDNKEYLRPKIKKVNEIIAKLDNGRTIRYADFGQSLLEPDGVLSREIAPDGLHPKAKGYERWAKAMEPLLTEMVGAPSAGQ